MVEQKVGMMDACSAGQKAAPKDAPWVDLTDASMAGQMVAEKGASMVEYWAVR